MEADLPISGSETLAGPGPVQCPARMPRALGAALRQALQFLLVLVVAYGSYFVISHFFLQSVRVAGVSMQPTLRNTQICFLNRWIYYVRSPQRGDIVVLRDPVDDGLAVKRIVGVSGDWVDIKAGKVFLNGRLLAEPYLGQDMPTYPAPRLREQSFTCGKDEFVVLGDNRMNSADSRIYGAIKKNRILGMIK